LYNAEYQIQLMERKVARARGERTLEEKKDLQAEINKATATNSKIKEKHKILNEGVKKLDEDLRSVESRLAERKAVEKKYTSQI
jgi:cell division protein FtsB